MSYNHRCTDRRGCGARKTLKHPIDWYIRRPKCPGCKKDKLRTVHVKERARTKRRTCKCDGWGFPHRTGAEPWCRDSKRLPGENDIHPIWG